MEYFRAGGAADDADHNEKRRKREEALAWAQKRREQRLQREKEKEAAANAEDAADGAGAKSGGEGWGLGSLNPWGPKRKTPLPTKASLRPPEKKLFGLIPTSTAPERGVDEEIGYQYEASMMDKVRWKLIDAKHKVTPSRSRCCCCCSCTWCIIIVVIIVALLLLTVAIGFAWKHKAWLLAL